MTTPRISVIVPTYNRISTLPAAIHSVLSQSFQDLEVLVVDDGSTDDTGSYVKSLADPRIRYLFQENQGLPVAWNRGMESCRGKYVAFLDSDDYWLDGKLQVQWQFLEQTFPESPACVTGYIIKTLNGREVRTIPSASNASLKEILRENKLHLGTTLMCRREVIEHIGPFDVNLRRGQDTDWLLRYRMSYPLGIIPEPLAMLRQHLNRSAAVLESSRLYFLEKHRATMLQFGRRFYRARAASVFRDLSYEFSRENNRQKAREYAWKSTRTYPLLSPGLWLILVDSYLGTRTKRWVDSIRQRRRLT